MQLAVRSGRQSTFTWRLFDGLAGSLLLKSQDSGVDVAAQGPMAGCHRGGCLSIIGGLRRRHGELCHT